MRLARIHRGVAQIDHLMNQLIRQDHFSQAAAQLSFSRVDVRQLCAEAIEATGGLRLVLSLNGVAVVLLGVLPGPLMAACVYAITQALAS